MIVYQAVKFLIWAGALGLIFWFISVDAGSALWARCVTAAFAMLGVWAFILFWTVIFYADEKEKNERS